MYINQHLWVAVITMATIITEEDMEEKANPPKPPAPDLEPAVDLDPPKELDAAKKQN